MGLSAIKNAAIKDIALNDSVSAVGGMERTACASTTSIPLMGHA